MLVVKVSMRGVSEGESARRERVCVSENRKEKEGMFVFTYLKASMISFALSPSTR